MGRFFGVMDLKIRREDHQWKVRTWNYFEVKFTLIKCIVKVSLGGFGFEILIISTLKKNNCVLGVIKVLILKLSSNVFKKYSYSFFFIKNIWKHLILTPSSIVSCLIHPSIGHCIDQKKFL